MKIEPFSLAQKKIILIGGLGILGTVFARYLLEAGAELVIGDKDEEAVASRADELSETYPGQVRGYGINLADEGSVSAFAQHLAADGFVPNVLINNAGCKSPNFFAPLGDFPLDDWNEVMSVNVTGVFLVLRALLPKMIENGGGTVISTGSLYGIRGPDKRIYEGSFYAEMGGTINTPLVYAASKGAVSMITKYLAATFGDQGIRANTLIPGGVFSGQNETFVEKFSNRTPMGRMAEKDEIATALVFLASDASSYMTGQDLVIDGGVSSW